MRRLKLSMLFMIRMLLMMQNGFIMKS